jgi:hypothetical protein
MAKAMRDIPIAWKRFLRSVPGARRCYIRSIIIARAMMKPIRDALLCLHGVLCMWDVITKKSRDFLDDAGMQWRSGRKTLRDSMRGERISISG